MIKKLLIMIVFTFLVITALILIGKFLKVIHFWDEKEVVREK